MLVGISKCNGAGYVMLPDKVTPAGASVLYNGNSREQKHKVRRIQKRWLDNIKERVGINWHQIAADPSKLRRQGDVYIQE